MPKGAWDAFQALFSRRNDIQAATLGEQVVFSFATRDDDQRT